VIRFNVRLGYRFLPPIGFDRRIVLAAVFAESLLADTHRVVALPTPGRFRNC
jgi:hypothetical protein